MPKCVYSRGYVPKHASELPTPTDLLDDLRGKTGAFPEIFLCCTEPVEN